MTVAVWVALAGALGGVHELEQVPFSERQWVVHTVRPRERLAQLAARYGIAPRWIRRWNDLPDDADRLEKDSTLKIRAKKNPPPRERVAHVVTEEDTWWRIAARYGVTTTDLRAYNWRPGSRLKSGESLTVWVDPVVRDWIAGGGSDIARKYELRTGGFSIGAPNEGQLVNGVRLPETELFRIRRPESCYGTSHTVETFLRAMETFRAGSSFGGRIRVTSISRERGGRLGGHVSHQTGRDMDVVLPLRESVPQSLAPRPSRVDWWATWELIDALHASDQVLFVFLDYKLQRRLARAARAHGVDPEVIDNRTQWPRGRRASRGFVRDSPGHDDHIHVRFRCGPHEPECVE